MLAAAAAENISTATLTPETKITTVSKKEKKKSKK
jgi:hypothetical protein